MLDWKLLHPRMTMDHLGFIPHFLNDTNPEPAKEQIDANYKHGGGWHPFKGFKLAPDNSLTYPGDQALHPLAEARLRDELILFYNGAWVAIVQPDRTFEVARID